MAAEGAADGLPGQALSVAGGGERRERRRELPADAIVLAILGGVAVLVLALRLLPLAWVAALLGLTVAAALAPWLVRAARAEWFDGGTQVLAAVAAALVLLAVVATLPIEDGEAILIVGVIASVGSLVEYRRRLVERRRAVAVALAAEILVNAKATWGGLSPEVMAALAAKPDGFKPYAVPVPPDYPVYAGNQEALGLLPAEAVRQVVSFYETDEFMTQAYNALGTAAFHQLERERQNRLYEHITERMEEEYLPAARRALVALAAVSGEAPLDLPPFLASAKDP
jgi:hypothetical protein